MKDEFTILSSFDTILEAFLLLFWKDKVNFSGENKVLLRDPLFQSPNEIIFK